MASKKKVTKSEQETPEIIEKEPVVINENDIIPEEETKDLKSEEVAEVKAPEVIVEPEKTEKKSTKSEKSAKSTEKAPKYSVGSIVFVSKDAEADLNGFKLFPPYKKYTYTVEAYDAISDVYSLRRLNLSLKLKEADIVAPSERAHDSLNRKQF